MNADMCKHILVVGPEYREHRGGIGAVIESHSRLLSPFNFIPVYKSSRKLVIPFYYIRQALYFMLYLFSHPSIKIVHIHGASHGSFYRKYGLFLIAKYLFSKKIIYHIHGGGFSNFYNNAGKATKRCIRHMIEKTDVLVPLSPGSASFFRNTFNSGRLEVIPNSIDLPVPETTEHNVNGRVIFLFLGKITHDKGAFDLVHAAQSLIHSGNTTFELWIGGNGETSRLEKFITENHLESHLKYLGWISGTRKSDVLRRANVYVLPSYYEGMPVSILETMAYGMPVIATRVGGIPELVQHKVSGLLIEPGDTVALQEAMNTFLNDTNLIPAMGHQSKAIVKAGFSTGITAAKLKTIYEELMKKTK